MNTNDVRFSSEDADSILRRILERKPIGSRFSLSDLESTAAELGISKAELQNAIESYMSEREGTELKTEFLKNKRRKFFDHLAAYCIVNTAFILTDIFTTDSGWFKYSLIFWGIGLAFDAISSFFPKEEDIEKGILKLKKKKAKSGVNKHTRIFSVDESTGNESISFSGKNVTVTLSDKGIVWKKGDTTIEL